MDEIKANAENQELTTVEEIIEKIETMDTVVTEEYNADADANGGSTFGV